jgi:NAD(P)H-dependent FMN reductase
MSAIITLSAAAIRDDPAILLREMQAGSTVLVPDVGVGYALAPTDSDLIPNLLAELDDEEAADMVSLSKDITGIDNVIFVSTKYHGRHAPRIKIAVDPPGKFSATGKNASMAIHDYGVRGEYLPPHVLEQAKQFIERNRDVLVRYWEEETDTPTFIRQLRPPG